VAHRRQKPSNFGSKFVIIENITSSVRSLLPEAYNEEFHNLYSSQNIVRHIKTRRMRWAGYVARMAEKKACTGFLWESPKEKDQSEDRGVDGKTGSQ
jgi:hypothetical protein